MGKAVRESLFHASLLAPTGLLPSLWLTVARNPVPVFAFTLICHLPHVLIRPQTPPMSKDTRHIESGSTLMTSSLLPLKPKCLHACCFQMQFDLGALVGRGCGTVSRILGRGSSDPGGSCSIGKQRCQDFVAEGHPREPRVGMRAEWPPGEMSCWTWGRFCSCVHSVALGREPVHGGASFSPDASVGIRAGAGHQEGSP